MRNFMAVQKFSQFFRNPGRNVRHSKSSIFLLGIVVLLLNLSWLGGCSSSPKSTSDPTKEEVQTDSDRFFKNLEKEEAKKETQEGKP
jgi:hypothetical protein